MTVVAACLVALSQVAQANPLTHQLRLSEGLDNPARLAVAADEILVADTRADTIVRFDLGGNLLGTWSEPAGPTGIALAPDGRVYVSRRDDAKVAVYSAAFAFQGFVADGVVSFEEPTDLAVDEASGRLYVVDSGADRIYALDNGTSLAWMVGTRGSSSGQFKHPSAIAVDAAFNRVIVADQDNFRVQIYTSAGVFLSGFGYRIKYLPDGDVEGWLPRLAGVAVDASGNIVVSDAVMGTLQVFDPYGAFLGKVVGYGSATGQLQTPGDVEFDSTGRVLVANSNRGTVEVYDPPGGFVAAATGVGVKGTNESAFDLLPQRSRDSAKAVRGHRSVRTSAKDIPVVATVRGWDPPHTLDDVTCGRCHDIDGQPEGHVGTVNGQANLCISCHTGAGSACPSALRTTDRTLTGEAPPGSGGRSHAWGVPASNTAVGSIGPTPGGEMERFLAPGNIIKCSTCHDQHSHGAGSPYLRIGNSNGAMCKECHAEHIGHTPAGPWQPTCDECHDMHNPKSGNLALIDATVNDRAVLFTSRTGPNSLEDGDPAENDGLCQVCHTATTYHTQDGTGASHNDGEDCTSCHPHEAGFMPTGGDCTSCHATVQDLAGVGPEGGRRAVVGEFPTGDAHAHYGAELDEAACVVCHDQTTHMDGNVDLIDPDSGALHTFVRPYELTLSESDPDLTDFCMNCHDSDGAARLGVDAFDPFGDESAPADVAAKFQGTLQWDEWYGDGCFGQEGTLRQVNSHHDVGDADQAWSGARIECLHCHGPHAAGETQPVVDPFNITTPWTGSDNEFCISCHWGGFGPDDPGLPGGVHGPTVPLRPLDSCDYRVSPWYVSYTWTHAAHGLDSKRGWTDYSGAPGAVDTPEEVGTEVECMSCHDPHGSFTPANTLGNPYAIRDSVDGTPYVDDGVRPGAAWTGPPWDDEDSRGTVKDPVLISISGTQVSWGNLCSACHAGWLSAYDWHSYCDGCQTCHGHGQDWQNYDWGSGNDEHTPCPQEPALLINGAASGTGWARDDETRTAPHPDDGSPVPLHGIPSGL